MKQLKKLILAFAATGCLAFATTAQAIIFDVSASLTPGSGYGVDAAENGGTLLDVVFASLPGGQNFSLNAINDAFTFDIGTVNFREPDTGSGANKGIRNGELDNLGVVASFVFTNPLAGIESVTATGTAILGPINDAGVDYTLNWDPVLVNFGFGGQFKIDLLDLSFSATGVQTQKATVTLLALPQSTPPVSNVPEPATLALLGFGLVSLGYSRRKRAA